MQLGLKLWSTNTDYYYNEAARLYVQGIFDFIELYVVPNTLDTLEKWKKLDIPFTLHAPHFKHKVNLADASCFEYNKKIYEQVEIFRCQLRATHTIVHAGTEGHIEETIRQLNLIKPTNFLIENKPYRAPLGNRELCRGYSVEEIQQVLAGTNCGFCLDISHAACTANSLKKDPYQYIEKFNHLSPVYYHICDGDISSPIDQHLNIGSGNFDFKKIINIIGPNSTLAVETKKSSKENLNDFLDDIMQIKKLMRGVHACRK